MRCLPRRLGTWAILLVFTCTSACVAGREPTAATTRDTDRDLAYATRGDEKLLADVHRPEGNGPWPAVVLVHGGSWARGDRRRMERVARKLVERDYAAINIEYRLAPEHRYPTQVEDVLSAVCWTRSNATRLNIDPERIALWGYSAGAHLSVLAASQRGFADGDPACSGEMAHVQACIGGSTPSDLRRFGDIRPIRDFLGGSPDEIPATYAAASPILAVSADHPPTFLYHGRSDWIVDIDHSRRLHDRLKAAGVRTELFENDYGHMSQAFVAEEPIDRAIDFLDQSLATPAG